MFIKKIPDVSYLVTTTVLNTEISEVENKIPDTGSLVTTSILNTKIGEKLRAKFLIMLNTLLLMNLIS